MLSPLVPAAGISVKPVRISAQEGMKNIHMVIHPPPTHTPTLSLSLQVNYVEIIWFIFFFYTS
jgi:hypothetical protein